ncbi:DUF6730 family protein [Formosa sp. A9]|uniref:DUF6730 family protein n=1 Tax=Formosa sp. A9 TaxID=3442641 RepID=UPI003EB6A5AC
MTKLEELTALLVEELHQFNLNIEKLERLNSELKSTKLKIDVSEYKSIMESHQNQMQNHEHHIEQFHTHFSAKIKRAKMYPTWAVVVFIITLILSLCFVFTLFNVI